MTSNFGGVFGVFLELYVYTLLKTLLQYIQKYDRYLVLWLFLSSLSGYELSTFNSASIVEMKHNFLNSSSNKVGIT